LLFSALLTVGSCAPEAREPLRVCPGKATAAEALSILGSRTRNAVALKANGQCLLWYYLDRKKHSENFPVKLWLNPPVEIYLQGDVAFNPRGVVLGSNKNEFWLAIRPKEVSSYYWGRWAEKSDLHNLMLSPKIVLEALGIAEVGDYEASLQNWSLSSPRAFDVLTRHTDEGRIVRTMHVYKCDYLVRKIEYFDADGSCAAIVELDDYRQVVDGFSVPASIKITRPGKSGQDDSVTINLNSIRSATLSKKQRDFLFTRPEPEGFKHVYKVMGGNIVEQRQ
jgi:hypothetical protein